MSYFNVFFQAAICHSWFPAAKLRLKKRSYGNNCDRRILKKHKKVWGNGFRFLQGYYCCCEIFCIKSFRLMAPLCRQSISPFLKSMRVGTD